MQYLIIPVQKPLQSLQGTPSSCISADFTENFVAEEMQGAGVSIPSATATVPRAPRETSGTAHLASISPSAIQE